MDPATLKTLAWSIVVIGMVGAVLPLLPGPLLIWGGTLLWTWADNWNRPGVAIMAVLTILALVGESTDMWVGAAAARKGGASWIAIGVSFVLGIAGFFVFSVPGALLGSVGGILLVEWARKGNFYAGFKAALAYFVGSLLSIGVQLLVGGIMVAIFYVSTR